MLTKYGIDNIIFFLITSVLLLVLSYYISKPWISYPIAVAGSALFIFTFLFFRDPDRKIPDEAKESDSVVLAPADGKIVEIIDVREDIFLKEKAKRISIFLSPLNVHVNRSPVRGIVKYLKYHPGDYIIAYHPKSSDKNEQTHIGIENNAGKVFFKQIVGILARRLVWDISTGDSIEAGQRFGMMKFGSRMDVFIPMGSEVFCKSGQRVVAGETIIAKMIKH